MARAPEGTNVRSWNLRPTAEDKDIMRECAELAGCSDKTALLRTALRILHKKLRRAAYRRSRRAEGKPL